MEGPQANLDEVVKIKAVLAAVHVATDEGDDDDDDDDYQASSGLLPLGDVPSTGSGTFDTELQSLAQALAEFGQSEVQQVRLFEHVVLGERESERGRELF